MTLRDELFETERELAGGDGDTYRRLLADDAVIVIPGQVLTKEQTAVAMDSSAGWDEFAFSDEQCVQLGHDSALLNYRFDGRRGDVHYTALMGSVYVKREGGWRMAFHQQTPLG